MSMLVAAIVVLMVLVIAVLGRMLERRHRLSGVKVAVIGPGAIGSCVADAHIREGAQVEFWYDSRRSGWPVRSVKVDRRELVQPAGGRVVGSLAECSNDLDTIFWCVKNYDLDEARATYAPWVAAQTKKPQVVFVENGIWLGTNAPLKSEGNPHGSHSELDLVRFPLYGYRSGEIRGVRACVLFNATRRAFTRDTTMTNTMKIYLPDTVTEGNRQCFPEGFEFLDGARMQEIQEQKIMINCAINGLAALSGGKNAFVLGYNIDLAQALVSEAKDFLELSAAAPVISRSILEFGRGINSMATDYLEGKPTEIANLNGSVDMPWNRWVAQAVLSRLQVRQAGHRE